MGGSIYYAGGEGEAHLSNIQNGSGSLFPSSSTHSQKNLENAKLFSYLQYLICPSLRIFLTVRTQGFGGHHPTSNEWIHFFNNKKLILFQSELIFLA